MNLSIGIVGLPNVGKSTLFNALLGRQIAQASNYPFCTIDPNVGVVEVPDEKLQTLATIVKTPKIVPAIVEFVDIAGLVKGAAQGEGLGNKFLTNIRDCDAICHVVRDFKDDNVVKEGSVDPQGDFEVICAELIIKDLETIDKYIHQNQNKPEDPKKLALAQKLKIGLEQAKLAQNIDLNDDEKKLVKEFFLLTSKPYFIVLNIDEQSYQNIENWNLRSEAKSASGGKIENLDNVIPVCAKIEFELSTLSSDEKIEYLDSLGLKTSGLERVINKAYDVLGLQSFYTAGIKEARAWTIHKGDTAPAAAGVIHTDFERGFIMAEVVKYDDFVKHNGWEGAKAAGVLKHEPKVYIMHPDDVVEFRFNV
jgi:hypothetical protein